MTFKQKGNSEDELIKACMEYDRLAQFAMYKKYASKFLGVASRFTSNYDTANDMLQESFIKIFNHINQYEFKGSFEGWMRRIVVRTCINYLEKHKQLLFVLDTEEVADDLYILPNILERYNCEEIIHLINELPLNYKTILNLYAVEGYAYSEISELLSIKEVTIRSIYLRAKLKLLKLIEKQQKKQYNEQII